MRNIILIIEITNKIWDLPFSRFVLCNMCGSKQYFSMSNSHKREKPFYLKLKAELIKGCGNVDSFIQQLFFKSINRKNYQHILFLARLKNMTNHLRII